MKKHAWKIVCATLVLCSAFVYADGLETFDNFPETGQTYRNGTFLGQDGSTWTYVQCSGHTEGQIDPPTPHMGRNRTPMAELYSGSIPGGMGSLTFQYRKSFTTAVKFDVFVNDVLIATVEDGESGVKTAGPFNVNIPGNVVIRFAQNYGSSSGQVGIDNVAWTRLESDDDPNIYIFDPIVIPRVAPDTVTTQTVVVSNTGTSQTLHVSASIPLSGDTQVFSLGQMPPAIAAGESDTFEIVYTPGMVTGAQHSAQYGILSNDPSDPTNIVTVTGSTTYGTLRVYDIQFTTDPSGDSPFNGEEVTVEGVVTYIDPLGFCIADEEGGPWSGVYVYAPFHRPYYGERLEITATVNEYFGMTQLQSIEALNVLSVGHTLPVATVTVSQANAEAYESVLVHIENVTVSDENVNNQGFMWAVTDGADTLFVEDLCPYRYIWRQGATLDAIRGVMWYSFGDFKISPRYDADFIGRDVMAYALKGCVMTPEGPHEDWYVQVWDDTIVAVTNVAPSGVTIVETDGIIFPGLIDAHNHPSWNSFPTLMFYNFPFGNRDQWGRNDPEYDEWRTKRNVVRSNVQDSQTQRVSKWGEILQLMAGCIAIQGNYDNPEYAHPNVILYNVEQFPSRIEADIFPWTMSVTQRTNLLRRIEGRRVNAVLIHLCEGPDATSHAQFARWRDWGMLNEQTAILHGTPLTSNDFVQMAAVGAKLVWSPMSNMKLYEATANPKLADQVGVVVGLAPDWTPSGGYNMLEELAYAWHLNETMFDSYFTPEQMVDMATINNAIACGFADRYGMIREGYNAGFVVIDGDVADPYMSLINARPKDVKMTIIDGMPRYGDPDLLMALGQTNEIISVHGVDKMFNVAFEHPFLDHSNESVSSIRNALRAAHGTLFPSGNLDRDELQFLDFHLLQVGPDNVPPFRADNPIITPANGAELIEGVAVELQYARQDFWDNMTDSRDLVQREIGVVRASAQDTVVQVVATNVLNYTSAPDKRLRIPFTPDFVEETEPLHFRFLTEDLEGNVRTSVFTDVSFTVIPEPTIITMVWGVGLFALVRKTR